MSAKETVIRRAAREEAGVVAAIVREGFQTEAERYGMEIPPLREVAEDVLAAFDAGEVVMLAEVDGHAVGTVRAERMESGSIMIRRLAVLPSARRAGIARALMLALEDEYVRTGTTHFELFTGIDTAPAIALYESLGYVRTREETGAAGVRIVYLEKSLD